jgi:phospholipid/cholesterol/gamma-HCH transport system ATP-binding protein
VEDQVLSFDGIGFDSGSEHVSSIFDASFCLAPGDVLLVRLASDRDLPPVVDMALGLLEPSCGTVRFMGRKWSEMDAFEAAARRGQVGSVFERPAWISSLNVSENVMLRERHHTRRHDAEIVREAEGLAALAGLGELSALRPDAMQHRQRRVYEWVRACMGAPKLLLLACPERGAPTAALTRLVDLVKQAASRGAAVVWLTDEAAVWTHKGLDGAKRSAIEQDRWISL